MATKKKLLEAAAGAAGGTALNVEQVFSTFLYEGNGTEQVIENDINLGQSYGSGSINIDEGKVTTGTNSGFTYGTGDFTLEAWVRPEVDDGTLNSSNMYIFDHTDGSGGNLGGVSYYNGILRYYTPTGGPKDSTQAINNYEWAHVAVSRSSGTTRLFYNGTAVRTQTNDTYNYAEDQFVIGGFGGSNGYGWNGRMAEVRVSNIARYTSNFTAPTTGFTSDSNTILLTGQGSTLVDNGPNSIELTATSPATASGYGPFDADDAGEGGLVWAKSRGTTDGHFLFDTERGATKRLRSHGTNAENTDSTSLTSFNANGFSIGNNASLNNSAGTKYASWTFRKAPKFFDVVTYTGTGSAQNISHNLGSVPGMIITKRTDGTGNWVCYHRGADATAPEDKYAYLETTGAFVDLPMWNDTAPTDTQFSVGVYSNNNASGGSYVAYLFAHNDGDGEFGPTGDQDIIKCGSYTTDASADATINLGWEPQWVMFRPYDDTSNWKIVDNMRGFLATASSSTGYNRELAANTSGAELNNDNVQITSTGFDHVKGFASKNFIYIAIRRGPMAVPEDADDVFAVTETSAANNAEITIGFPTDLHIANFTSGDTSNSSVYDRLRGFKTSAANGTGLLTSSTAAENTSYNIMYAPNMTGYKQGNYYANANSVRWDWKRAPNYFDVVAYTGNGTRGHTINHNLGVAPEMIWVKNRDQADFWVVYHSALGNDTKVILNATDGPSGSDFIWWAKTDPTDQVFSVGESGRVNGSGENLIAYLFASLDGVSKVGSFSHTNGTATDVDCGFSSGARFVLVKRYDSTGGNWVVCDSARGIVSGNDPYLLIDSTNAQVTNQDVLDPLSSGFTVAANFLASGNYIFYAIA